MDAGGMTLADARDQLGLGDEMTADDVRRAYQQKSYELIRRGVPQPERDRLKAAETALLAALAEFEQEQAAARRATAEERRAALALLALLFVAGWRERKPVPMCAAVAIAGLQYFVTWRLPEHRAELWLAFGGVGGEFCLSAAMMGLFFVRLPAKFRWGACRYLFLFLGAATFFDSWVLWRRIRRGDEDIP